MKRIAELYKALGDETRLKIIQMLAGKEMCVCEIIDQLDMSQPAVSHHLKILKQANLVSDSREGKWIYYALNDDVFAEVFGGEGFEPLGSYIEPIQKKIYEMKSTRTKTEPALCEKLTSEKK